MTTRFVDDPVGVAGLTILFTVIGGAALWIGIWGLRGRDIHIPGAAMWEGNPDPDPFTREFPLRGRAARWAGAGFIVVGLACIGAIVRMWF